MPIVTIFRYGTVYVSRCYKTCTPDDSQVPILVAQPKTCMGWRAEKGRRRLADLGDVRRDDLPVGGTQVPLRPNHPRRALIRWVSMIHVPSLDVVTPLNLDQST
ncbi:hypothetical protein AcV5_005367 [Taiwanofungus camphoratus]|nr:hypothetical protein AcV5_005367 [Antrodia cinnamomea]